MAKNEDTRDASLRVSKKMRDSLKAAAANAGRPLYDVTNEAINNYLASAKAGGAARRTGACSANRANRRNTLRACGHERTPRSNARVSRPS